MFVAEDKFLFVENWVPPRPPQRWLMDLGVDKGSAKGFVLRAELLSAQRSFLSGATEHPSQALEGRLSAEEGLLDATSIGHRLPLSSNDCSELWHQFSP
jgi:hypothetical protein